MKMIIPIKALSVNAAFQGRRFKTKEHNQYCKDVLKLLPKNQKISGFVEISYKFYLVNWKRTDAGNLEKCLTDILVTGGLIDDDRYIMRYVIEKFPAEQEDWIQVEITEHVGIGK
jgi:Holliday junction resolvase RusA-like endonuclease